MIPVRVSSLYLFCRPHVFQTDAVNSNKNIVFIGAMGAGKTTIGRQVAKKLNRSFYDSDCEIEERTGADIPWIFEIEGESGFRKRESEMLRELLNRTDIVLSTGGGAVLAEENRSLFNNTDGYIIYLKSSPDKLHRRIQADKRRPLLNTVDKMATIIEILSLREPLYMETADIVIDTDKLSINQIIKTVLGRINQDEND